MAWFYLIGTLLILFFLVRNVTARNEYKRLAKEAVFVFEDQRKSFKVSRIIFAVLFVFCLLLLLGTIIVLHNFSFDVIMGEICLTAGCALFSFVPYTNGRFVVTEEGIYVYNAAKMIPWSQMITVSAMGRGKSSFLVITTAHEENERFTRNTFPLLITPADQTEMLHNMIRDFINLETKRQHLKRLKQNAE